MTTKTWSRRVLSAGTVGAVTAAFLLAGSVDASAADDPSNSVEAAIVEAAEDAGLSSAEVEVIASSAEEVAGTESAEEVVEVEPLLWPAVVRCLVGIGVNSVDIARIMSSGAPLSVAAGISAAAVACVRGR